MNVVQQPIHALEVTQSVRTYMAHMNATVRAGTRKMPRTSASVSTVDKLIKIIIFVRSDRYNHPRYQRLSYVGMCSLCDQGDYGISILYSALQSRGIYPNLM